MAEFEDAEIVSVIEEVVNKGTKLQLCLRLHHVKIEARTAKYQRLYRHIQKLRKQKESLTSGFVCVLRLKIF